MEIIFELVAEFVLQVIFELFADWFGRALKQPFSKRYAAHPVLAVIAYALLGAALGGLSLLAFPKAFIRNDTLRIAYLVLNPFLVGLLMQLLGGWLERGNRGRTKLETFAAGFAFAAAFGLVRYFATRW
jgi:hypothetical protein